MKISVGTTFLVIGVTQALVLVGVVQPSWAAVSVSVAIGFGLCVFGGSR